MVSYSVLLLFSNYVKNTHCALKLQDHHSTLPEHSKRSHTLYAQKMPLSPSKKREGYSESSGDDPIATLVRRLTGSSPRAKPENKDVELPDWSYSNERLSGRDSGPKGKGRQEERSSTNSPSRPSSHSDSDQPSDSGSEISRQLRSHRRTRSSSLQSARPTPKGFIFSDTQSLRSQQSSEGEEEPMQDGADPQQTKQGVSADDAPGRSGSMTQASTSHDERPIAQDNQGQLKQSTSISSSSHQLEDSATTGSESSQRQRQR